MANLREWINLQEYARLLGVGQVRMRQAVAYRQAVARGEAPWENPAARPHVEELASRILPPEAMEGRSHLWRRENVEADLRGANPPQGMRERVADRAPLRARAEPGLAKLNRERMFDLIRRARLTDRQRWAIGELYALNGGYPPTRGELATEAGITNSSLTTSQRQGEARLLKALASCAQTYERSGEPGGERGPTLQQ